MARRANRRNDRDAGDPIAAAREAGLRYVKKVAGHLGNTAAVCRKCYVHPLVIDGFTNGITLYDVPRARVAGLASDERAVLSLIANRIDATERRAAS